VLVEVEVLCFVVFFFFFFLEWWWFVFWGLRVGVFLACAFFFFFFAVSVYLSAPHNIGKRASQTPVDSR